MIDRNKNIILNYRNASEIRIYKTERILSSYLSNLYSIRRNRAVLYNLALVKDTIGRAG